MQLPVTYVWTHDSIGLGEDGPTHQPVEHLAVAARHPGPGRRPPGRRQRDRGRLARRSWSAAPARRHWPDPAEPARRSTGRRATRRAEGVAQGGYVLAEAAGGTRGDPDRHRLRGPARRRGARAAGGRGHPHPGRVDAVRGVVRGAGRGLPREVLPPAVGPGSRSRPAIAPDLAAVRRRRGRVDRPGALRCLRRLPDALPRSSASPPSGWPPPHATAWPGSGPEPRTPHAGKERHWLINRRRSRRSSPRPGSSIWLDDLSRRAAAYRQPGRAHGRQARRRRHHQPDDLRQARWPRATPTTSRSRDLAVRGVERRGGRPR